MRDSETVRTRLQAAETGHLVLSTLHTTDATETVNRLLDFFPPFQQQQVRSTLAGALRGMICQRLVPSTAGGRVPILEVLVNTGRISDRILDPSITDEIKEVIADGEFYGMRTFDQSLLERALTGARATSIVGEAELKVPTGIPPPACDTSPRTALPGAGARRGSPIRPPLLGA
jgi:twitching motility protein PilT